MLAALLTERASGFEADFERADDPAGIARLDKTLQHQDQLRSGVHTGLRHPVQLRMASSSARNVGLGGTSGIDQPSSTAVMYWPVPPTSSGSRSRSWISVDRSVGQLLILRQRQVFVWRDHVDQVVDGLRTLFRRWFRCADVHFAVNLAAVGADDFAVRAPAPSGSPARFCRRPSGRE